VSCARCGRDGPVKRLAFHQHVGLLLFFIHSRHAGAMCRLCGEALLRRTTIVTSLAGWWGLFSAFLTPLTLLLNLVGWMRLRTLDYPDADAEPTGATETKELGFGAPAVVLTLWSVASFFCLGSLGIGLAIGGPPWLSHIGSGLWVVELLATPVLAILVVRRGARVAHGTPGAVRYPFLAQFSLLHVGAALLASVALGYATYQLTGSPLGPLPIDGLAGEFLAETVQGWMATVPAFLVFGALFAIGVVIALVRLISAITCWWLAPARVRSRFWTTVDLITFVAFVATTLLLPIEPTETSPEKFLPALRLGVTTFGAARLLFRLVPIILDLAEIVGFRLLVAARMLRARKTGFLTLIGALSILAVTVSTCMLTLTLSIMGGFRNDLKTKLLGNNAHLVVDRESGTIEDWAPLLERVRESDEVVGASPFVTGDVMITSSTNLSGAVLRGIDPRTIGRVTDLPRNMRHGSLTYLQHPDRLLRLRVDEMSRGLRSLPSEEPDPPREEENDRGSLLDDIERATGEEVDEIDLGQLDDPSADGPGVDDPTAGPVDPDAARLEQDLDEFLLEDRTPVVTPFAPPDEEVLPGVIVGQELAHTLRLHVGDEVDIVSPFGELGPSGPIPKTRPFRVAGIFYSGMYEFDMNMAYVTLEDAQRFLNVGEGIHGIEAKLEDAERAEPVARAIASSIGRRDVRVRAWQEVNRNLFGALQLEKIVMFIVLGMAILVASFCVIGSLTLMVQEKAREVGILKAMGASGEQVVAVFMAQGLMIGLLGAVMGLGLGFVQCFVVEHFGFALNPEVYYIDRLPVFIDPVEFASVGIAAVVICLLATIYPALLASRLRPVDALRDA
jgi:lipoprotein-releasing system permease protein